MSNFNWDDCPTKDSVRRTMFEIVTQARQRAPLNSYLCLPSLTKDGKGGICVRRGIDGKAIGPRTKVVGYEIRPGWADRIQASLRKDLPGHDISVHEGDLSDAPVAPRSIDFAFLDYTGFIDAKAAAWIQDVLVPGLASGAALALTVPFRGEGSTFVRALRTRLNSDLSVWKKAIEDQYSLWEEPCPPGWPKDHRAEVTGVHLFLMKYLLRRTKNKSVYHRFYQDKALNANGGKHIPMMLMVFTGIRPLSQRDLRKGMDGEGIDVIPDLGIVEQVAPVLTSSTNSTSSTSSRKEDHMTKQSKAAFKAHATRRSNALFAKRSAAARKAWRTRRAA
jgi:hypothetical protein